MITHFIGSDEVAAYCRDLAARLISQPKDFPEKWFPIGQSGEKIAEVLYGLLPPEFANRVVATTVYCDRNTGQVQFEDKVTDVEFDDNPILLIDSAVHSGQTMKMIAAHLWTMGVKNLISYTLMLKRNSAVIPTYFGIVVADKDRVYFQLDTMPNNRLCEKPPFGVLREVSEADAKLEIGDVGPPFEDISMASLVYDKKTKNYRPYIFEYQNKVCGLVSFGKSKKTVFIDAWATVKTYRGQGIGDALLRWAETWGRSNKCDYIELWAFHQAIPVYLHYGYQYVGTHEMSLTPGEPPYRLMGKKLLYNTKNTGHWP